MQKYYIIYKPAGMLSQFSPEGSHRVLGDLFPFDQDIYPVGRLDADSEGLLLLTNDKTLNNKLLNPKHKHKRTYWVQVEGAFTQDALLQIQEPMTIKLKKGKTHRTLPCHASILEKTPNLPERNPPIRFRKNKPTSWITITLTEGKNRQVRKMTAKVGFPTLRLVRTRIEEITLQDMQDRNVIKLTQEKIFEKLKLKP